jgi:signal transduction histidine kinase
MVSHSNTFDDEVALAAARLVIDQTKVNEALVQRILRCECKEEALRASEQKLQALLAHQLSHREDERRRVALEIHDAVGQNLLALRLDVAALQQHTARHESGVHSWVGAALDNLDGTIRSARKLIDDLRPFQLELGIEAVLDWEVKHFARDTGIACKLKGAGALDHVMIDEGQLLAVYRVLQECLRNIELHASASSVSVTVAVARKKLTMRVADDGIGIDPAHPPAPAFGLMGMRERLREAGGTFALARALPGGTVATMTIPLRAPKLTQTEEQSAKMLD